MAAAECRGPEEMSSSEQSASGEGSKPRSWMGQGCVRVKSAKRASQCKEAIFHAVTLSARSWRKNPRRCFGERRNQALARTFKQSPPMLIQRSLSRSLSFHRAITQMTTASLAHDSIIRPHSSFPIYSRRFFSVIPQSIPFPVSTPPFASFAATGKESKQPIAALLQVGGVKITKDDVVRENDPANNVPDAIFSKLGMQLHRRENHPIGILKNAIYEYFDSNYSGKFVKFDDLSPIVSVKEPEKGANKDRIICDAIGKTDLNNKFAKLVKPYIRALLKTLVKNFDDVLVPADHVSRSNNDTYYVDAQTVLRCHTSAHQAELLKSGHSHFLVTGDVYRRDSIDSTHYPVFHQMEGVRVFCSDEWVDSGLDGTSYASMDLKKSLEGLAQKLFGDVEMRWIDTYFPFTNPSFELEIYFQEKWMEVLGCGVTEQEILERNGKIDSVAWAFGLGLERLAMVLFDIPDIRLFWSTDQRFTSQFSEGKLGIKFKPFSKYPPCYKDMSFWISDSFTENNLCEVVRGIAGDLVEEVRLIDNFTNKKGMTSHCYRIAYRSMERSLTDEEINQLQGDVREAVQSKLKVILR
ncbi:hypothetical protein IEQ34_010117 [Dendrobium chrysotoxum]|uniref:phenylalanine--tRNA ligase n=1 Tax=Dendrobium chrysotoxum TaxID=161865 RepID=A0AAV7H3X1_DENCH|nr:hypothetical protein IEQ34_010117 [Dendrobium chrysotoxum]